MRVVRSGTRKIKVPKGPVTVEVGFPEGEVRSDIIDRALWNEFGTSRIPERPFMRNTIRNHMHEYQEGLKRHAKRLIMGEASLLQVMTLLGIKAQTDMKEELTSLSDPPNAPSTIKAKGSSNPLIDTGEMRDSITYRVNR